MHVGITTVPALRGQDGGFVLPQLRWHEVAAKASGVLAMH